MQAICVQNRTFSGPSECTGLAPVLPTSTVREETELSAAGARGTE
jgi:hypothetical protein